MSETGYYTKSWGGLPAVLYVLGTEIAMMTNKTGEWVEMEPGQDPVFTTWKFLSDSEYDAVLTKAEAEWTAIQFGTTLAEATAAKPTV